MINYEFERNKIIRDYCQRFNVLKINLIQNNFFRINEISEEFEEIYADFRGDMFNKICNQTNFKNLSFLQREGIHKLWVVYVDNMKLYKQLVFGELISHFSNET